MLFAPLHVSPLWSIWYVGGGVVPVATHLPPFASHGESSEEASAPAIGSPHFPSAVTVALFEHTHLPLAHTPRSDDTDGSALQSLSCAHAAPPLEPLLLLEPASSADRTVASCALHAEPASGTAARTTAPRTVEKRSEEVMGKRALGPTKRLTKTEFSFF